MPLIVLLLNAVHILCIIHEHYNVTSVVRANNVYLISSSCNKICINVNCRKSDVSFFATGFFSTSNLFIGDKIQCNLYIYIYIYIQSDMKSIV